MSELKGQPGELRATILVTRAGTGKVEHYTLVGHSDPEKLRQILQKEREKLAGTPETQETDEKDPAK